MAYDPNDPKDVEIVEGLVAERLETETAALKKKNADLIKEKRDLQKNGGDPAAIEKLENQIEELQGKLDTTTKEHGKTAKDRDKLRKDYEAETSFTRNLLIDNGLTGALAKAKVAPTLMQGAKALLSGKAQVVIDGDKRVVKIGDKDLDAAITEWSQSDEGKAYVTAPASDGGGANGGRANSGTGKTATRAQFNAMEQAERSAFFAEKGTLSD